MSNSATAPTRVRYGVLAFAGSLAAITYLDRVCFGSAQSDLRDALGLSNVDELSNAIAAFSLAYAAFEVPTGWLGDVFGPRSTLIRVVLWWSFFTALTGLVYPSDYVIGPFNIGIFEFGPIAASFLTLLAVRFLFGLGEAGAYP